MRRGLISQKIRKAKGWYYVVPALAQQDVTDFGDDCSGLGYGSSLKLSCILEEPKTELSKYETFTELQWHKYEKVCLSS